MLTSLFCYLWLQQQAVDPARPPDTPPPPPPAETAPPPSDAAPPAAAPPSAASPTPEAPPALTPPTVGADAQSPQNVRAPGSSLMNPALSLILDGTFGYYGWHADSFAALGLPIAGDDPTDAVQ